jgi:phosphatidylserine/phosphatidylglycerophosphate/cardiolipin synthase-like enzyme
MFHIAAPNPGHPTFALMDALRQAHQRGVTVRVLLDRDGKKDPYLSTIVNSEAKHFFAEAGIACRSDSSARLLHSKYLLLDLKLALIGSHNWSAGSYFGFDDLTLAIASRDLAADLAARFEAQWAAGS